MVNEFSVLVNTIQLGLWIRQLKQYFVGGCLPANAGPIAWLEKQPVTIVLSSLITAKSSEPSKPTVLKRYADNRFVAIDGGYHVTGIFDAVGLAKLSMSLTAQASDVTIVTDLDGELSKTSLQSNLILIGGPSSNLIASELYSEHIPEDSRFYANNGSYSVGSAEFAGGETGHVLWTQNPWNSDRHVLWLAGLGPAGTGAAIDMVLGDFSKKTSQELQSDKRWVQFLRGEFDQSGARVSTKALGHELF